MRSPTPGRWTTSAISPTFSPESHVRTAPSSARDAASVDSGAAAPTVLERYRAQLHEVARALSRAARVLCLDELYVADIADAMILGALFDGLFRRGVTLVATSNVPPAELYRDGLQRQRFLSAIALLERHLEVVRIAGATDYRLRQLTQAGTYLAAGAPDTEARLAALFACLADGEAQSGGAIEIEGRPIGVIRAGAGVAW